MGNSINKKQLIELIYENLEEHAKDFATMHRLVITGIDPTPCEVRNGETVPRCDMTNFHEEADVILIDQEAKLSNQVVFVLADDTDIFVLLLHFVFNKNITSTVYMLSFSSDSTMININETIEKHSEIVPSLLVAHALSGCDTVAALSGIRKKTVVNVLKKHKLPVTALINGDILLGYQEATAFILRCYGEHGKVTLTEARRRLWKDDMA